VVYCDLEFVFGEEGGVDQGWIMRSLFEDLKCVEYQNAGNSVSFQL
jgi:hypothetical protein